jgi:hypothetical protein
MREKKDRGKCKKLPRSPSDRSLPQSLKEVVQMWEKIRGVKVPETFDEFLKSGDEWREDGFDEQVSDDWKTSEGTSLFVTEGNGCEVWLEIPFTTVRVYGKPAVNHATFFDGDNRYSKEVALRRRIQESRENWRDRPGNGHTEIQESPTQR